MAFGPHALAIEGQSETAGSQAQAPLDGPLAPPLFARRQVLLVVAADDAGDETTWLV